MTIKFLLSSQRDNRFNRKYVVCVCVFLFSSQSVSEFGVFSHLTALNTWPSDGRRHRLTQLYILYKRVNSHNEIDSSFSS